MLRNVFGSYNQLRLRILGDVVEKLSLRLQTSIAEREEETAAWTDLPVKDVMTRPAVNVLIGETASEIAAKMITSKVGSVVVINEGKPIGIVTDGDLIVKVLAKDKSLRSFVAMEIMSKPLRTVDYEDSITEAARRMRTLGIKRLGVMKKGELIGVISVSDIASVAPDLLDLLSEKVRMTEGEAIPEVRLSSRYCDQCGTWSEEIRDIDGSFVCEECKVEWIIYE